MSLTRAFFLFIIAVVCCGPNCTQPLQGQIWTVYNRVDPYHRPVPHSTCFQPLDINCYGCQPAELPNMQTPSSALGLAPDTSNSDPNTLTEPAASVVEPNNNADDEMDESLIDNQDSASDLNTRTTEPVEKVSDLELENEQLQAKIAELQDRLMKARQQQAEKRESEANGMRQARNRTRQRIAEAINQAKKESAWEIAKLRKDSETLNQRLAAEKEKSAADREKLLKRLKSVEAKLKSAKQRNEQKFASAAKPKHRRRCRNEKTNRSRSCKNPQTLRRENQARPER